MQILKYKYKYQCNNRCNVPVGHRVPATDLEHHGAVPPHDRVQQVGGDVGDNDDDDDDDCNNDDDDDAPQLRQLLHLPDQAPVQPRRSAGRDHRHGGGHHRQHCPGTATLTCKMSHIWSQTRPLCVIPLEL